MDDLTPVKGPATPFEGRSAKVMALVIVFLLVALIKPWGDGSQGVAPPVIASAAASQAPVAVVPSPTASHDPWANYDHEIFGIYEPEPRWELWPAGYLVSFGYAIRIESTPAGVASPVPVASGSPVPSDGPFATQAPSASPKPSVAAPSGALAGGEPIWPATIRITDGNHLGLVGVNMPLGYRVTGIGIFRTTDGADEALDVITPASDWPSHFTVVALADQTGSEAIERWPPGQYRLELKFEPGAIERTIEIEIDPTSRDVSGPSASPEPG